MDETYTLTIDLSGEDAEEIIKSHMEDLATLKGFTLDYMGTSQNEPIPDFQAKCSKADG